MLSDWPLPACSYCRGLRLSPGHKSKPLARPVLVIALSEYGIAALSSGTQMVTSIPCNVVAAGSDAHDRGEHGDEATTRHRAAQNPDDSVNAEGYQPQSNILLDLSPIRDGIPFLDFMKHAPILIVRAL